MNILFDLSATQPNKADFHGGGEYAKTAFRGVVESVQSETISACYEPDRSLSDGIKRLVAEHNIDLVPVRTNREIGNLLSSCQFDRLYSALPYGYYDVDFSGTQLVFTIHGLRSVEQPTDKHEIRYCDTFKEIAKYGFKQVFTDLYRDHKRRQIKRLIDVPCKSLTITVPSKHTKYSLLSNFPSLESKQLRVIHSPLKKLPSIGENKGSSNRVGEYGVQSEDYFLITSARRWVKNAYRAIQAFDKIFSSSVKVDKNVLVLGARDNSRLKRGLENPDRFIFEGYVSTRDLNVLYRHAYAFVYPTLNEGFGYPPLESMRYGTPVLAGATSAVTEICGDAALYFNPFSISEIKNRALAILLEDGLKEKYVEKGAQRFNEISSRQERMMDELCELILGRC